MSVVIETTLGDITVDLYLKSRPNTCLNFLKLCKIKYYNLCVFHKVERGFIAQSGDPTETGRGGESVFCHLYGDQAKYFESELKPRLKHEKFGTLSMVNNGNNMNGSQFFLTLGENLTYLDDEHTVFGEVAEGFEILHKINEAICDPNNRPYQDIRITHTVILHDPYEDPKGLVVPDASPEPTKEQLESNYIGADEEIDDTKGKSMEEIEEKIKENEAKARATILEMVGDIPDAEVKPPDNVLFVCKLNPVTTSEDLEVIFSRFGTIISCEVIKDKKTDESLQYAFIEFEKEEDCENAFFKMDNVLIDDRRIHVDFSQSVSKLNWKDGKPPKEKSRKDNLFIKNSSKSDGYDMIFDMNESPARAFERKKHMEKPVSSEYKSSSKSYSSDKYQSKHMSRSSEYKNSRSSRDGDRRQSGQQSRSPVKDWENTSHRRKYFVPIKESDSYTKQYNLTYGDYYPRSKSYNKDDRMSHQKSRNDHVSYNPKLREKEQKHGPNKESLKPSKYDTSKRKISRSSSSSSGSDTSGASPSKKSRKKYLKSSTSSDSDSSSSSSLHVNQHHNRKSHSSKSSSHKTTEKLDCKYSSQSLSRSLSKSPEHSQKRTSKHSPSSSRRKRHDSSSERERSRSPRKEMYKHNSKSESIDSKRNKSKRDSSQEHRMPPEYSTRKEYRTISKSESSHRKEIHHQKSESACHRLSSQDHDRSHKKHSSKKEKHHRRSPS